DVKPSNIMLDRPTGQAKLTDFGLVRVFREVSAEPLTMRCATGPLDSVFVAPMSANAITVSGALLGSPPYMSPEQIRAPEQVAGRSDVFSLGVVLYEMLTGERPFRGTTPLDVCLTVLERQPVIPRYFNPSIPADLEALCLECLEKEPSNRPS